jgi:hypothetical protein
MSLRKFGTCAVRGLIVPGTFDVVAKRDGDFSMRTLLESERLFNGTSAEEGGNRETRDRVGLF